MEISGFDVETISAMKNKIKVISETVSSSLYKSALTVLKVVDIEIMHS